AQGSGGGVDEAGALAGAAGAAARAEGAALGADVAPNGESEPALDPVVANGDRRAGPSGRGATEAGGVAAGGAALAGADRGGSVMPVGAGDGAADGAPRSRRAEVRTGAAGALGAAGRATGAGATARDISPVGRWIGARRPVSSRPRTPAEADGGRTIGAGAGAGAGLCSRSDRRDGALAGGAANRDAGAPPVDPAGGPNGDGAAGRP
ncbi:hypothetical protein ACWF41_14200, partial [Isoptericola sp. NPDC055063]